MKESKNGKGHLTLAQRGTISARLTAISVVVGILCKDLFTFAMFYRFTLENLGVITAGIFFGPLAGGMVGLASDIISCLLSTNPAVNPIITLGAVTVGVTAGVISYMLRSRSVGVRCAVSVAAAHLFGQVIIKSIAKMVMYGMPWYGIFIGAGFSLLAGAIEYTVIVMIAKNKQISKFLDKS